MNIVYVGAKPMKSDNVAETKLIWERGQIHAVADEVKAAKLLSYKDIWADADKPYSLRDPNEPPKAAPPTVTIIVPGAKFVLDKTDEEVREIAAERLLPVFMTKADSNAFAEWKLERDTAPGLPQKQAKKNGQAAAAIL